MGIKNKCGVVRKFYTQDEMEKEIVIISAGLKKSDKILQEAAKKLRDAKHELLTLKKEDNKKGEILTYRIMVYKKNKTDALFWFHRRLESDFAIKYHIGQYLDTHCSNRKKGDVEDFYRRVLFGNEKGGEENGA